MTSSWLVSLALSLVVVLGDAILSALHLQEALLQSYGAEYPLKGRCSLFGQTSHRLPEWSPGNVQQLYASMSNHFNVLVAPAILATFVGLTILVWVQLPHGVAVSFTVVEGLGNLWVVWIMAYIAYLAYRPDPDSKTTGVTQARCLCCMC